MKNDFKYCACYSIILIIGLFSIANNAFSELSGSITNPKVVSDTLDFGVCMPGDKRTSTFYIKNTGDSSLKIGPLRPSLSIETIGGLEHINDHDEFEDNITELIIEPGATNEIKISFKPKSDTINYPVGLRIAKLTLGMYNAEIDSTPQNINDYVVYKEFILIAGKVRHYLDGKETSINFDSVYVNPSSKIDYLWKLSNASQYTLIVETQRVNWVTAVQNPPDIEIENKLLPLSIPPYSGPENWLISYKPKNRGYDSVFYSLGYKFNDTLDFTNILISGFGVEQNLNIIGSEVSFNNDTIDVGRVWVNETKKFKSTFSNKGNLNFGAEEQTILDGIEGVTPSESFELLKPIPTDRHYLSEEGDTFTISFTPNENRSFLARYVINSDITKRQIRGLPGYARKEIFYLKGEGIEPILTSDYDTVKFGNVVWHQDCPSSKTFTLKISNTGNTQLQIFDIKCNLPFKIEYFNNTKIEFIAPQKVDSLNIIFSPNTQDNYLEELIFVTNSNPPKDTKKVILTASRVDPDRINLSIPMNLKAKPGNQVSIPIIADSNYIGKARTFSDTLTYNKSLLGYAGYSKLGTAAENTDDIDIRTINGGGRLSIKIQTPSTESRFLSRDTLLILNFNSYIGDDLSTPVAFVNPLFGDGVCDKVLLPVSVNGVFTIDSICGLKNLLLPSNNGSFFLGEVYPNPAGSKATLQYELKFGNEIEIMLFDELGLPVLNILNESQKPGLYEAGFNCESLSNGIYYLKFKSGFMSAVRRLVVAR